MARSTRPVGPTPVQIPLEEDRLDADLALPEGSRGLVVFAHGSGSGRHSPRNRFVAEALEREGLGTLLLDLLTAREAEEDQRSLTYRFRITLLAARLVAAIDWAGKQPSTRELGLGIYGASTGGAAALLAAAERPDRVRALVLRGARSDLADASAPRVHAPTLFVVGALDTPILEANRITAGELGGPSETTVVAGATHLFEEPGTLEQVAERTAAWFLARLADPRPARRPAHHLPSQARNP